LHPTSYSVLRTPYSLLPTPYSLLAFRSSIKNAVQLALNGTGNKRNIPYFGIEPSTPLT
jgi:hypothetical protein